MEKLSDIALVTQVAVFHNKRAFDQLVRKYQSPVRRLLQNLTLGNEALSDDLAQDTFLKAYTNIAQFRAVASFQTWLFSIAYHTFYDYTRSHKHEYTVSGLQSADVKPTSPICNLQAPASGHPSSASLKMDIYKALSLLKDEERGCVTLQLIDGYAINDIARMLNMPENTVKSHLRRGKEKLTTYLKNNGYDR